MQVETTDGGRLISGITGGLVGKFTVPGDKSISHRAVMLGSLAEGTTLVDGFLNGDDCLATINCFRALGVDITIEGTNVTIKSTGSLTGPDPTKPLDVGNSGTTLRLMAGLLCGQPFTTTLTGDESIQKRPMKRVTDPLSMMGADIDGIYAPITIKGVAKGAQLKGINYTLPVASAQVKSAILLASLYAEGETVIEEPIPTRDHTEIMLKYLGADITKDGNRIISRPLNTNLTKAKNISVPGDISSAAFLMAGAAILPGSAITIKNVGVNPTRTGIIHVLRRMGSDIKLSNNRTVCGEPVADIEIRYCALKGTIIEGAEIPTLIDEIPAIAAVALFATGKTIIKGAQELRVKETDRITAVAEEFGKFFAGSGVVGGKSPKPSITPQEDGMIIDGMIIEGTSPPTLQAAEVNSRGDHRLAMSLSILALSAQGTSKITDAKCADISFPGFYAKITQKNI